MLCSTVSPKSRKDLLSFGSSYIVTSNRGFFLFLSVSRPDCLRHIIFSSVSPQSSILLLLSARHGRGKYRGHTDTPPPSQHTASVDPASDRPPTHPPPGCHPHVHHNPLGARNTLLLKKPPAFSRPQTLSQKRATSHRLRV